jgi:glycosyltransferase involved in cell wall biosynthesis
LRWKKNLLWDVRGLWGEQKFVIGSAKQSALMKFGFRSIESFVAFRAKGVTTLAHALFPILERRTKRLPKIRAVVPTCVDIDLFEFNGELPKQKTLLLSGVFNNFYDIELTRELICELKSLLDLKVVWCKGSESDRETLDVGEDEIRVRKQSQMPEEIAESTLGIALCKLDAGDSLAGVMPTKIAEFLSVGRPVIISAGMGDLDKIIEKNDVGIVLSSIYDHRSVAVKLRNLIADRSLPARCRSVAESVFNMKTAILTYEALYIRILDS